MTTPLKDAEHGAWQALPVGPLGPRASEPSFLNSGFVMVPLACGMAGEG